MTGIKLSAVALLAASAAGTIGVPWTQDAVAQSLVHRWSFNGDFLDDSGSGNHGTPSGAPAFVAGKFGQGTSLASATLDGVHLDFFAANLPLEATDHWTMNVWANLAAPPGNLEHIAGFSLDDGYLGAADIGRGRSFISQTGVDNNDFYFWGANADRASGVDYSADGQWHMYTISYNGTNLNMYKDGLPVISAPPAPNALQLAYDEVHVGNPSQWNSNFDGVVDEFAIFNGALSEGQIGGLFVNNDFTQQAFLNPTFSVNRDTGEIVLNNDSSFPVEVLGYAIKSPSGSLKPADWDTIAGRFDDAGDGSIDPNHNWTVLTNASQTFSAELSEGVPGTDGGTIAIGKTVNFGAVWAGNPIEDVSIEILLDDGLGTIKALPAEFIGNSGNHFVRGDLDADGDVDAADWAHFRTASSASLAGATQTQAYLGGDFDGDFDKDIFDFSEFAEAYDAANGGGAFQALLAVPEPGAMALAALAVAFGAAGRCARRMHATALTACLALYGLVVPLSSGHAAVNAYYQFNGNANEDTGVNINLNLVGDAGFIGSLHPGLGLALSLDGAGGGAIGENYGKIQTDDASAVAWVYATSADGTWDSILKQWGDVRGQFHFGLGGGAPAGTGDFLQNEYATAQNASANLTAPSAFPVNQWVHVAFVLDAAAGQHRLYMNGEQIASMAYAGTLANKTTGATGLGVGVKPNTAGTAVSAGAPGYWNGYLDEIAVYDHALSETDIETIMANGINGVQIDGTTTPYIHLEVNRTTGDVKLINNSPGGVDVSAYQISSSAGRLQPADLDNLAGNPGFPAGNGTGNGWETDGANNATQLLETYFSGASTFETGLQISLGDVFAPGGAEDLVFQYRNSSGAIVNSLVTYVGAAAPSADFDSDGDVDGADFLTWQRGFGLTGQTSKVNGDADGNGIINGADLNVWKMNFGSPAVSAAAAVPEPHTAHLFIAAAALLLGLPRL